MDDGNTWYLIIALILFILCGYFNMTASAIVGLNDSVLKERAEDGEKRAKRLFDTLQNSKNFVDRIRETAMICGVLATALGTVYFELLFLPLFETQFLKAVVPTVLSALITVFAVISCGFKIPQQLGNRYCERLGYTAIGMLKTLTLVFSPLRVIIHAFSVIVSKLLGADPDKAKEEITEEEIRMLVDVGNEIGFIEESQKEMINNIFEFDDTTAGEVMTHRTEVIAVEKSAKISEIVYLAINEGFSRLPVYDEDIDSITGLIYVKDLLCLVGCDSSEEFKIEDFIRPVIYIPESTKCRTLFAEFKKSKAHLAVVVDEYGGTAGIVSMEDILESIVGEIEDEYDEQEEEVKEISDGNYVIEGTTRLDDLSEILDLDFENDEDFDTLGGFLFHMLGFIPKENEEAEVTFKGYKFTVLSMDERRIDKVKVEKLPEENTDETEE